MRILMMTNTYTPIVGGLEKSIESFSTHLREKGHEVRIAAPEFEGMPKNEKYVTRIPAIKKVAGTEFSVHLPIPGTLEDLMDDFSPEIVHAHHPFLMGDLALRLSGQYEIPLVFTYHTMFEWYTDYFGLDNEAIQKFVVQLAKGYAQMADQVIVPSESIARVLSERKVTTPIAIVPTGVDTRKFSNGNGESLREKLGLMSSDFVVGHLGRLSKEKNLIFLSKAVVEFLKKKNDAHFVIVGDGPAKKELESYAVLNGVKDRMHFVGVLSGQDVVDAYHAMNLFVFASKSETQGMVITEAMAAGLPVVALDAPGVREVVRHHENGCLLAEENISGFCEALDWCASKSAEEFGSLRQKAIKTAELFSIDNCVEKAINVYRVTKFFAEDDLEEQRNVFSNLLNRFKTELEMLENLSKASRAAIARVIAPD